MTLAGAVGGLLVARWLAPAGRGYYAGITTWPFFLMVLGELGLSAALVYFTSRDRGRVDDYVRTGTAFLTVVSVPLTGAALLLAPTLSGGDADVLAAYRVGFASIALYFLGAAPTHALQLLSLQRWGMVRLIQPTSFVIAIVVVHAWVGVSLLSVIALQISTFLLQSVVAWVLYLQVRPRAGRVDFSLLPPLVRFGLPSLLASGTTLVNGKVDQLVMSLAVPAEELGRYAVAVSLAMLGAPVTSALGHVLYPRLAAESAITAATRSQIRRALQASYAIGACVPLPLAVAAQWLVVPVFGAGYAGAATLLIVLAPGSVMLAANALVGDMLRGLGRPAAVARAQGVGVLVTIVGLFVLLPPFGAMGAALTSTVVYAVVHVLLLSTLRNGLQRA